MSSGDDDYRWEYDQEVGWEHVRKQLMPELYEEFARDVLDGKDDLYSEIIEKFTSERLQSYYVANPRIAERALWALTQARGLLSTYPEASLVFAITAAEVGLKSCLLKPILHGLVHNEAMAVIIAELIPEQRNDKFQNLLFTILNEYGGIDLRTFQRLGMGQTLWQEVKATQTLRNSIVHRGEHVSPGDAHKAVEIASAIIEKVFPSVITRLGLEMNSRLEVSVRKPKSQ
jgi:hypothetical protein